MITLQEAMQNIGRRVVYTPYQGAAEEGVISGVSPSGAWILVWYGMDQHPKATAPAALEFAAPKTDDTTVSPPPDSTGVAAPTGAERATVQAVASSSATEGRVTSEVATLSSVPQRRGGEPNEEGLGLVAQGNKGGQQVLGTCSPGTSGSPEVSL